MPPAAWSGQWVSNAGGHQSRDLNPVFIAGKRLFADRDKWGQNRPPARLIDRGDRPLSRNPATSRSFTVSSGNLLSIAKAWWGWKDSNLQPDRYERTSPAAGKTVFFPAYKSDLTADFRVDFRLKKSVRECVGGLGGLELPNPFAV